MSELVELDTSLGDVLRDIRNGTTATQDDSPTEFPVSRIETISDGTIDWARVRYLRTPIKGYLLEGGDILFSHINSLAHIGKVAFYDGSRPLYHGMNLMLLPPDDAKVMPKFLLAVLQSEFARQYARRACKPAVNQTSLGQKDIKAFRFWLPDPAEQRRIAEILDTADEAIQKTEALIAKLKQMKAGLLHDLLTRGIDENGELRDPQNFVDGIPMQWKSVLLSEVVPDTEYGISTALKDLGDLPVLRMNNFQDGEANVEDVRYASCSVPDQLLLKPGDVLFNRTNSYVHVGRTGIWRGQLENATFASYLVRLNPDAEQLTREYLNLWLNLPSTQVAIRKFATPAVQQVNINPTMLRKATISLPCSITEQNEIVRRVDAVRNRIESEAIEVAKLKELKAGLMHDLLTGKKRVNQPAVATV